MNYKQILKEKIYESIKSLPTQRIGIAFSGGIDSSLLAKMCKDAGKEVCLFTIGFENDHDIKTAKEAAEELELKHYFEVVTLENVEETLKKTLPIVEYKKLAGLSTSIGFYHVLKLAAGEKMKFLISANGADELFCGYNRYMQLFPDEQKINEFMNDIIEIAKNDKKQVQKISSMFGIVYDTPLLEKEIIEFAKTIPLSMKIENQDDNVRKHIIRKIAIDIGLPEKIAMRPKKAFQYSSGIHKTVRKLAKKNGFTKTRARKEGFGSEIEMYIENLKGG